MDRFAVWIQNFDRDLALVGQAGGIVDPYPHGHRRFAARFYFAFDMHPLQRNRRDVHQVHIAIDTAVEIEVAEARWDHLDVARIVAPDRDAHAAFFVLYLLRGGGDVDGPFVVAANVLGDLLEIHEHFALLPRT